MGIGKGICSILLAGSVGVVTGILLAPGKGSQTRKRVKQKAEDFLENEINGYNSVISKVKAKLDEILNGMTIQANDTTADWADKDQKNEIIA